MSIMDELEGALMEIARLRGIGEIQTKSVYNLMGENAILRDALKENQAVLKYTYNDIQALPVRDELLATVATKIQENRVLIEKETE